MSHRHQEEALLEAVRKHDRSIYSLSTFDHSLAMDLLVSARLTPLGVRRMSKNTAMMNIPYVRQRAAQPFKIYPGAKVFDLSIYQDKEIEKPFSEVVRSRRSCRSYSNKPVSLMHLGVWLYNSYGHMRTELLFEEKVAWKFRPIPSPGGLYASEIYLIALNTDLPKGLYHYRPDLNALEQLKLGDFREFAQEKCGVAGYIDSVDKIGGVLLSTSLIERLYIKYAERAFRFMGIEVGILAQQLSIVAEGLSLGTCMLGGYYDDDIHRFLGIDRVLESVQNVMVFGLKAEGGGHDHEP